jgi:hypothetical protein
MSMKDSFFDRKQYLGILEKRIRDLKDGYRQNIAIIGDELVGKTSVIFKFLNTYCDNRTLPLYLETRPETLASFAKRFIGVLLYNFMLNSGLVLKEDLNFLIKKSSGYIPKTSEKIKLILAALEKRKKNNIFTELLSLCELLHEETGKHCVVILDEFQNLESMEVKNIYSEWAKLLVLQKNTMYILVSSYSFKAKLILSKNLSLLFGNFEVITVEPFDIKTSEEYLSFKLEAVVLEPGHKNFIVNFTGGYPFYLKLLSEALLKSPQVSLAETLESLIFEPLGVLNQRFSNYIKRFLSAACSQDYVSVLYLIASGHNKIKDIAHILRKPRKELNSRIAYLMECETVCRSGEFLKINDRVFSFWLKFVYQEKLRALTFDARNQKDLFRGKIEAIIQDFLLEARKPVIERVSELLRLFEDDTMQIERKKIKLNSFREIKPVELGGRFLKEGLIGRSHDSFWIMGLKYEPLTEKDVIDFSKECKKYRNRQQKRIILAFKDIDTNARLRALEEKIITWDLNNLNQILDLFSKPRVIL